MSFGWLACRGRLAVRPIRQIPLFPTMCELAWTVLERGFEPPPSCLDQVLNLARLPIPPLEPVLPRSVYRYLLPEFCVHNGPNFTNPHSFA